jgi:predicted metal-binding membrane protein
MGRTRIWRKLPGARTESCVDGDSSSALPVTTLEAALLKDRTLVILALVIITALCWLWIVPMGLDVYGAMRGAARWMMDAPQDGRYFALLLAMWIAMMIGMMLPSAAPTLLLYATVLRKSDVRHNPTDRIYLFAAGYALIWSAFSIVATELQFALVHLRALTPMMESRSGLFSGALLVLAGIYQLTPAKSSCLTSCRTPALFITKHWRKGRPGALFMGLEHGLVCLGCCWALMLLLFAGGVMNLYCIAAIEAIVLLEKLTNLRKVTHMSAALLLAAGVWVAVSSELHVRWAVAQ